LQSKPPQIPHITAGISTVSIFREPVSVVENEDEGLELVFVDYERDRVYRPVEKNKLY
jgi:hypothetical protein